MAQNSMKIGFKLTNFQEMRNLLKGLPASVESRVMGDAVKIASKHIVTAAKQHAPVRSGALRRSIISIVKRYPKSGKIIAIIGPDKTYYNGGKRIKKGESRRGLDRPANYAHLVEFGHFSAAATGQSVKASKGTTRRKGTFREKSFIPAKPFLRPAILGAGPAAERDLARGIEKGMEREIKRLASKMKRLAKGK